MKNIPNSGKTTNNNNLEKSATVTFTEFILCKKARGLSDYTLKTYENHFNYFLKVLGGDRDITEITTYDYNCFYSHMVEKGVSSATIKSYSNTLRSFFNWCYAEGLIYYNVNIPMVKSQTIIKSPYTDEELERLLKKPNLKTCSFTEYKIWVLENLVISTGLRITSVINLKCLDFDYNQKSLIVNRTKNSKGFVTYLNDDMVLILKEYLKFRNPNSQDDYLFCTDVGDQIARRTVQDEISKYNKDRGVSKTSIHLLRHTFARNSILCGQDVFTLMHMLQHSNIQTTYEYLKSLGLDIRDRKDIYNPQQKFIKHKRKMR